MKSLKRISHLVRCSRGATQVEYALIASLLAMVILPVTEIAGRSANDSFMIAASAMDSPAGWAPFMGDGAGGGASPAMGSGGAAPGMSNNNNNGVSFNAGGQTEGGVESFQNDSNEHEALP